MTPRLPAFKAYDIRGRVPDELNPDIAYRLGIAYAEQFAGLIVHPQAWPEDLDYSGKRVLIIGSGATAVTLLPAMAKTAGHVTMLQRSPTYVISLPGKDRIANFLRRIMPSLWAYRLSRWKNVGFMTVIYQVSQRFPNFIKKRLLNQVRENLGPDYDIDTHFTPRYRPWEQRMCLIPDADMFEAIKSGRASVVVKPSNRESYSGLGQPPVLPPRGHPRAP